MFCILLDRARAHARLPMSKRDTVDTLTNTLIGANDDKVKPLVPQTRVIAYTEVGGDVYSIRPCSRARGVVGARRSHFLEMLGRQCTTHCGAEGQEHRDEAASHSPQSGQTRPLA